MTESHLLQLAPLASEACSRLALPAAVHPVTPSSVTLPPSTWGTPLTFRRRKQMRSMFLSRSLWGCTGKKGDRRLRASWENEQVSYPSRGSRTHQRSSPGMCQERPPSGSSQSKCLAFASSGSLAFCSRNMVVVVVVSLERGHYSAAQASCVSQVGHCVF